jgi:hypothetical protein
LPTMVVGSEGVVMALPGSPSITTPLVAEGGAVLLLLLPPPPPPPQPVSARARTDATASPPLTVLKLDLKCRFIIILLYMLWFSSTPRNSVARVDLPCL